MTKTSPAQPRTCQDPPTKNLKQIQLPLHLKKKKQRGPDLLTNPKLLVIV